MGWSRAFPFQGDMQPIKNTREADEGEAVQVRCGQDQRIQLGSQKQKLIRHWNLKVLHEIVKKLINYVTEFNMSELDEIRRPR